MNPGTIVLVRFWFINGRDYKIRPALIISNLEFNRSHAYCLMVPFTTKTYLPAYEIPISNEKIPLDKTSFIRTDSLTPIPKEDILKEIGKVPIPELTTVVQRIKNYLG